MNGDSTSLTEFVSFEASRVESGLDFWNVMNCGGAHRILRSLGTAVWLRESVLAQDVEDVQGSLVDHGSGRPPAELLPSSTAKDSVEFFPISIR